MLKKIAQKKETNITWPLDSNPESITIESFIKSKLDFSKRNMKTNSLKLKQKLDFWKKKEHKKFYPNLR